MSREGEIITSTQEMKEKKPVCLLAGKLFYPAIPFPVLDLQELFAFVRPAQPIGANITTLSLSLGLPEPTSLAEEARNIFASVDILMNDLRGLSDKEKSSAINIAYFMKEKGKWLWSDIILSSLGTTDKNSGRTLDITPWDKIGEWEDTELHYHASSIEATEDEVYKRLKSILSFMDKHEVRHEQVEFAKAATLAFSPKNTPEHPCTVLVEAGTGVGKTLGYIAPASVWTDKNSGQVWISTFTKNLQHQIAVDFNNMPFFANNRADETLNGAKEEVVIRKGRENYLCLLNYAEAVNRLQNSSSAEQNAVIIGLIARWLYHTDDGDLLDGDFPNVLLNSMTARLIRSLSDKKEECIYSLCPYFKKCFSEKIVRRSKSAKIVVANHALVMASAAGLAEEGIYPTRFIFDEAHHLFSACDSAFSSMLSGVKSLEMRLWLTSEKITSRSRNKGLRKRVADLCNDEPKIREVVEQLLDKTSFLCKRNWLSRIEQNKAETDFEIFLSLVRRQVLSRQDSSYEDDIYNLETDTFPLADRLEETAEILNSEIQAAASKAITFVRLIQDKLNKDAATLTGAEKQRYEGIIRQTQHKILDVFTEWGDILSLIIKGRNPEGSVSRMVIVKIDGHEIDVAIFRHYINPMIPFSKLMQPYTHGILLTSATLKDKSLDELQNWRWAEIRTGAKYLNPSPYEIAISSPFDYSSQTRVIIVTDINKNKYEPLAFAMKEMFIAAKGGAIGLFTSIKRLKAVYNIIAPQLSESGIRLFAQHVTDINNAALINMFKEDVDSCLLGTDAVRDGIDIPGNSLRLIVLDRLPWSRPDILHKARRIAFGHNTYEQALVRMRLIQGFGRLIRTKNDKGVFVISDKSVPSEMLSAFPTGVPVIKCELKQAVKEISDFLYSYCEQKDT